MSDGGGATRGAAAEIVVTVDVGAPPADTWQLLTDWDRHREWMLATRARATTGDGHAVGGGVVAWTGIGRLAIRDTMTVTAWDPPRRCAVEHTGRVVRGIGTFEVRAAAAGRSQVVWSERLTLPFGAAGRLSWPVIRPVAAWGLRTSLRRLARLVEAESAQGAR